MSAAKPRFKSLRQFVYDGLWAAVCDGIAEQNFSSFAVFLSATAGQIGFLSSGQQLGGCWLQLWSEKLLSRVRSRKRLVLICVAMQCLLIGAMTVGAVLGWGMAVFSGLAILYTSFGSLSSPIWTSWISDLLPARRRGACFSVRNQRTYPASFISLVVGGMLLDGISGHEGGKLAFCAVFAAGLLAKLAGLRQLYRQQEHHLAPAHAEGPAPGPLLLLREAWSDRRTRGAVVIFGAMTFAVYLGGPFQAPYLLKTLGYSYIQYAFLLGVMAIGRFLAAPYMGRLLDQVGALRLLRVASALLPLCSFGWCVSSNYFWLVAVHFVSGVAWAAYDLCAFAYLTELIPSAKRPRAFAARQVTSSLAAFAGAAAGAALLGSRLGVVAGIGVVFWASSLGRVVAAIGVVRMPRELPVVAPSSQTATDTAA